MDIQYWWMNTYIISISMYIPSKILVISISHDSIILEYVKLPMSKAKNPAYRQHSALFYVCDSGVPILYHVSKSLPWVLSIP